ncbi:unnamed protein product [Vicia faba]|uniref:Mediator complex subunit 15 KIX domain-containing protein n=1 Tax=Vicia faba TaxID=3906 RepID=A0AAV0ZUD1_VICFA|nr:unnamed protein product [Vicia faba]
MDTSDWRAQLLPDSRSKISDKILDTLKRHLPVSGSEGLLELQKIAQKFEGKIFMSAISQSDYLRQISLKMLSMETKSPNTITNNILPSQGNFGIAPIPGGAVSNDLRNQNNIGFNSTYKTNISAEVRPSSSTLSFGQEIDYPTQPGRFKRKKVPLENSSYSFERTESGIPKDSSATIGTHDHNNLFLQSEVFSFAGQMEPSKVVSHGLEHIFDVMATNTMWLNSVATQAKGVFKTWPHEKMKYEEDLQRLTDELLNKDELIAQLKEENTKLATKSEKEKSELSSQLESWKKACENANTLLKDANKSLVEVRKKNSDLGKSFGKLSKIKTEAV